MESWVWWCMPVIPALRRWRQEDHELKASLHYIVRSYLKKRVKIVYIMKYQP
jgi:hypothetical protein